MPEQREIWLTEHTVGGTFTKIHSEEPSKVVVEFADFLVGKGLNNLKSDLLDVGCGKGRNSLYLAQYRWRVVGIDFIAEAIEVAKARAASRGLPARFEVVDLTSRWPLEDASFEALIDCNTTICIPNPGRKMAVAEASRVLKPGGFYLFYGVAPSPLLERHPGPELNSGLFPSTGKFEKQYSREELLKTYGRFRVVKLDMIAGSDVIEGKKLEYYLWVAILQKLDE